MEKIKKLLVDIKETVNLDSKFYCWMYGVQSKVYQNLNNFKT